MTDRTPRSRQGKKVRVPFRRNRSKPARIKDWTAQARQAEGNEFDSQRNEAVVPKGELSRQRTIVVPEDSSDESAELRRGTVVAMRGLFAEVDDGARVWTCTARRLLRTRLILERHAVAVGDRVGFSVGASRDVGQAEGVIETVAERRGQLRRLSGKRIQTMVANVDVAIIVSSAAEPFPKPHLIDRYIVASLAGGITPVVCMNKIDLDASELGKTVLNRYAELGYPVLAVSATLGTGIEALRSQLKDRCSVVAGQSGVGKSSLLNAVQPELALSVAEVAAHNSKGRHTTTTATMIRLEMGGYVVDTPGVRSFDLSIISRNEFEAYFVEFLPHIPHCKFPNCTHSHETECAVKDAVESGLIHVERYESYLHLFEEPGATPV